MGHPIAKGKKRRLELEQNKSTAMTNTSLP
jgi:hypothetical protein